VTCIRDFQYPDDYAAVVELWSNAGPGIHIGRSDQPEEILKKLERDPDLFLVAEAHDRIVGTVMGGYDGRRGLVYHLAVDKQVRGQGLGEMLMQELEARLRARGCTRCYLLVTKDNQEAIRFYEQRSWERMDLFVYGKNL
jgi:ribosomal protein S18 acetylase RimI-like enzyme